LRSFNTCPDPIAHFGRCCRLIATVAVTIWLCGAAALAVDRGTLASQYLRQQLGPQQGLPEAAVNAIAQTPDGYLWIGTEQGLLRFDGQTFRSVHSSDPAILPITRVLALTVDAQGGLWIWSQGTSLLRYQNGKFEDEFARFRGEAGVTAIAPSNRGPALLSTLVHGTVLMSESGIVPVAPASTQLVVSLAETTDHKVWLGTRESGLFEVTTHRTYSTSNGLPDQKINCLLPADNGKLWIGTDNGLALWDGSAISAPHLSPLLDHAQILSLVTDRDSNLWIGTARGLLRYNSQGAAWFDDPGHEPDNPVPALFADREGNIWRGDSHGIERLRRSAFTTYTTAEGLPSNSNGPVFVDSSSRTWFAPLAGGLYWMRDGHTHRISGAGLDSDVVYSIAGSGGDIWVGRQRGGLTHLHARGDNFDIETYTRANGLAQDSVYAVHQGHDGSVWAGTLTGGVSRLSADKFTTYTVSNGLASDSVSSMEEDPDGTLYFGTANGLSSLAGNRWRTYRIQDGLPSDDVISLLRDSSGVLWIGTAQGLACLYGGHLHPAKLDRLDHEPILGMAQDSRAWLWIVTDHRIFTVDRQALLSGSSTPGYLREYGAADGLSGLRGVRRNPSLAKDSLGRLWFSMNRGISSIDPHHSLDPSPPAIAHIESVLVDGSPAEPGDALRVSSAPHRIAFNYTGLNFAAPDRVEFRYRLDGFDRDWSEPVSSRQAVYTNLSPGRYSFRVMASGSEGSWDGPEAALGLRVDPQFWQTGRFQVLCVLSGLLLAFALFRLRMRQIIRQADLRFEERLAERTRIAQELHDTLLQGFLSASMQLHIAREKVPADSPAMPLLDRVLQLMGQVIEEGRSALRGIRSSAGGTETLEHAFAAMPQLLAEPGNMSYRVIVEGVHLPLHPVIRDEVCRIGREALSNAYRHSQARSIEVEIEYARRQLRVRVRDDGRGIDPQVVLAGREGHWGLPGMRERANRIRAKLKVRSRVGAGTEVDLTVPGHVAYKDHAGRATRLRNWFPAWLRSKFNQLRETAR